jgi:hypothetical protein
MVIRITASELERWRSAFPDVAIEVEMLACANWAAKQDDWLAVITALLAKKRRAAMIELKIAKEKQRAKTAEEKVAERLGHAPRDENDLWDHAL